MFSIEENAHYERHFQLPELGEAGQLKLKNSSVLVIGAGGLGSPVLLYLAAAGIGKIGIVDADKVENSNLQRQIIHGYSDVNTPKVRSAEEKIKEINPWIQVTTYPVKLNADNALKIATDYDIIVDGSDNFETRYITNDVAYKLCIPNVYASIYRFEGQVSVFAPHLGGACYRCMLPNPPAAELAPT